MEVKLPQIVSIDPLCLSFVHLSIDCNLVHNIWNNIPVYRWKEVRSLVLIKIKMSQHVTSGYELYIISIEGWMYHAQYVKDAKMTKL